MSGGKLRAYGVTFHLGEGIAPLGLALEGDPPSDRECSVTLATRTEVEAAWGPEPGERIRALFHPNGETLLAVDYDESRGYRLDAPYHGRYLVTPDGTGIRCVPQSERQESWQHVLLAQVAPLAATLQGLEVFHASGVVGPAGAALFCADSGTGKSTLVARLAMLGAGIVADDAVAVERSQAGTLAHPGIELVHLVPDEAERLASAPGAALPRVEGYRMAKVALAGPLVDGPAPVASVYMLERSNGGGSVSIAREPADPVALLKATSLPMISEGARLRRHFELCADLAARVPLYQVRAGAGASREQLANAVWDHLGAEGPT